MSIVVNPTIRLLRPHQWLKNLMLFFPLLLSGQWMVKGSWGDGFLAFASFSLASSATYILNDLADRERDRAHPRKKNRPIASGLISPSAARIYAFLLLAASFFPAAVLPRGYWLWFAAYLLLSVAYSFFLKNQPVFDIFCIASGFVFRLFAGGAVFGVQVSDWLFLTVLLLALYLSAGKRLAEQNALGQSASAHRAALRHYPPGSLDIFMAISGAAVLVTYTMYVIAKHKLVFTVPLCCFGLFRYFLTVKQEGSRGDPTETLLKDPVMFLVGLAWALVVAGSIYWPI